MGSRQIVIIIVALAAAIGLAVLVRGMIAPKPVPPAAAAAAPEQPVLRVLVASRDLPVGARLKVEDLEWRPWPASGVTDSFITDGSAPAPAPSGAKKIEAPQEVLTSISKMEALRGAIVKTAMAKGEPVLGTKIVRGGEGGFLSVVMDPGMRAVGIEIRPDSAAGGFILPGDRVDVVKVIEPNDDSSQGNKGAVSETLLTNVRVLGIDQATEPAKNAKAIVGNVATLEVPAGAVEAIARAKAEGEVILVLRAVTDAGGGVGRSGGRMADKVSVGRGALVTEVAIP